MLRGFSYRSLNGNLIIDKVKPKITGIFYYWLEEEEEKSERIRRSVLTFRKIMQDSQKEQLSDKSELSFGCWDWWKVSFHIRPTMPAIPIHIIHNNNKSSIDYLIVSFIHFVSFFHAVGNDLKPQKEPENRHSPTTSECCSVGCTPKDLESFCEKVRNQTWVHLHFKKIAIGTQTLVGGPVCHFSSF